MDPVERAAHALKSAVPRASPPVPPVPAALVTKVRTSVTGVRRRRFLLFRLGPALAACAAAVIAGLFSWNVLHPKPAPGSALFVATFEGAVVLTPSEGAAVPLMPGMGVTGGASVTTHAGSNAQLKLQSGGEVELFESSELFVASPQRLMLREGGTRLHVKPLPSGHELIVATEDAEVEVKGTRFEVEVRQVDAACDVATPTRVHVDEGTVWVKHGSNQITLKAGDSWPTCGAALTSPKPLVTPAPTPIEALAPAKAPVVEPVVVPHQASLAEQNAKYREAIAARRRGDLPGALKLFEGFFKEHPKSPMAEAARVEHLRLLLKLNDAGAPEAARAYLSEYPTGFARDEAKAVK